jgi:DNA-binding LacI/PurR family transcriptional regulator
MRLIGLAVILAVAIALAPLAVQAQQAEKVRRIGVLMHNAEDDPESKAELAAFRQGLQQLEWSEDRNIRIDTHFAADRPDQYQVLAKKLVALQPDAIFAYTTPITLRCSARVALSRSCSRKSLIRSAPDWSRAWRGRAAM